MMFLNAKAAKTGEELPDHLMKIIQDKGLMECPTDGEIEIGVIGKNVDCSIHGEAPMATVVK